MLVPQVGMRSAHDGAADPHQTRISGALILNGDLYHHGLGSCAWHGIGMLPLHHTHVNAQPAVWIGRLADCKPSQQDKWQDFDRHFMQRRQSCPNVGSVLSLQALNVRAPNLRYGA